MVTINGVSVDAAGKTLSAYLNEAGFDAARVAVERNLEIVPSGDYAGVVLQEGDIVEIVQFVQGG